jgi:DNA-binding response OmpR family regulator
MNILLVEDNKRLRVILRQTLLEDGHQVTLLERGDEAREFLLTAPFDIAILDVMIPVLDGFTVLEQVRALGCRVPVLMLTARDTMPDIVRGLNLGADDYLTKPFQIQVFTARVRSVGRRGPANQPVVLTVGNLALNTATRTLHRDGKEVTLMRKEFAILELLMGRPKQLVTRDQLRSAAWPQDADVSDGSVDFYMHRLRSRLDTKGRESLIRTVRSVGYTMAVAR